MAGHVTTFITINVFLVNPFYQHLLPRGLGIVYTIDTVMYTVYTVYITVYTVYTVYTVV